VVSLASPGEVLVTATVGDLVAAYGFQLDPRGSHQLKGVPGRWPLFSAKRRCADPLSPAESSRRRRAGDAIVTGTAARLPSIARRVTGFGRSPAR
jgi:hypothetical protein